MKVTMLSLDVLLNDPANMRQHDGRNLDTIRASLKRFGQQKPIVVDADGVVVAGNGTLEAARALGWDKIAAVRTKLLGSDRTAYAIADNRSAELAKWDAQLADVLESLKLADLDAFLATGFDEDELERLADAAMGELGDAADIPENAAMRKMCFDLTPDQYETVLAHLAKARAGTKIGFGDALMVALGQK